MLARIRLASGDVEGGTELLRRSSRMAADVRMEWWRAGVLAELARLAAERSDLDEGERDAAEALRRYRQDENRRGAALALVCLARVRLARDDARSAGLSWGAVSAGAERAPSPAWRRRRVGWAGPMLDTAHPEFLAGVEEGRRLDIWDAVGVALGEEAPARAPSREPGRT